MCNLGGNRGETLKILMQLWQLCEFSSGGFWNKDMNRIKSCLIIIGSENFRVFSSTKNLTLFLQVVKIYPHLGIVVESVS